MIIPRILLGGLSVERADLYGKPHIGAWSKGLRYGRSQEWCPICGAPATNCHHIAGRGGLTVTVSGKPVRLLSPLMAVCGSGTTGCHGRIHERRVIVSWVWEDPAMQLAWFQGRLLEELRPHDPRLYAYGWWAIEDKDAHVVREVRR